MRVCPGRLIPAAVAVALLATWMGEAAAGCTRRVTNRSAYTLLVSQDGAPVLRVGPGRSAPIRMMRPGRLDLTATCGPGGGTPPVASISLDYEAVLDRCFIRIGDGLFEPQLGPGFIGVRDVSPFAVNNPNQGDVVLGPVGASSCPVLSRGG
ncbi:hypothetical protein [Methylobacterium planeticum]|uniref:Uncharacterized protein n=1 Tax=Methylobacterium planeticum TaxID=2615211 RepID=A0A6N6MQU2_9HYPH|nr:hypothetical protein [Methylobacterium planeticum]KAB1073764.1 hypothetical protein F6X51_11300 [Methylobacterium planeticum]